MTDTNGVHSMQSKHYQDSNDQITPLDLELFKEKFLDHTQHEYNDLKSRIDKEKSYQNQTSYGKRIIQMCEEKLRLVEQDLIRDTQIYQKLQNDYSKQNNDDNKFDDNKTVSYSNDSYISSSTYNSLPHTNINNTNNNIKETVETETIISKHPSSPINTTINTNNITPSPITSNSMSPIKYNIGKQIPNQSNNMTQQSHHILPAILPPKKTNAGDDKSKRCQEEPKTPKTPQPLQKANTITIESETKITKIDNALGKYYEQMRGNNSNYYDDRHNGIFAVWCDENGYDDDDVSEELGNNADPLECALTDFTDDFPFNNDDTIIELTEKQQKYEIFKIIQHCHKYGFDIRIKYGFDPLSDLSNTNIFLFQYINNENEICDINYDLSKMDLEKTIQIYELECDSVFGKKIVTDNSFEYGLAIGIKNNYFPFLQYLVDIYMRYCLQFVLKDIENRTLNQTKFNDFLRKNTKIYSKLNKKQIQSIIGAVDIYLRLCPIMHITKPLTIINDNIKHIIQYLIIINNIIQSIIQKLLNQNKENQIQFQFDVTIACNSTHSTQTICQPTFDDNDDDESSDENEQIDEPIIDVLGDVHNKLNENRLNNLSVKLSAIRKPENKNAFDDIDDLDKKRLKKLCFEMFEINVEKINNWNHSQHFIFMNNEFKNDNFRQLCDIYSKCKLLSLQNIFDKMYKDLNISEVILFEIIDFELECNCIKESLLIFIDRNANKNHFNENKKQIEDLYKQFEGLSTNETGESSESAIYPYKHRINMFIDRRHSNYENLNHHNFCDDIIFYECPFGSNILPFGNNSNNNNKIVHESFFNLTQKCLIPKIGYKDGVNEAMYTMNMEPKKRIRNSTISCRTAPPGGNVLIFSFHIISKHIIKCYLFRDAQFTRFLPQDIKHILPHIFNMEYNNNQQFVKDEKTIYEMISKLNYSDKLFNSWYNNRAK